MRNTLAIIYLFVFSLFAFLNAQNNIAFRYNQFSDNMPNASDDGIIALELSGKVFVLGSWIDTTSGFFGVNINRLDSNGLSDKLLSYRYQNYFSVYSSAFLKKNESALYSFGTAGQVNDTIYATDLHFAKYNANADTVFTRVYHDTGQVIFRDATHFNSSHFSALANYVKKSNQFDSTQICIFKIDSLGTLVQKTILAKRTLFPQKIFYSAIQNEYIVIGENRHQLSNGFYLTNFCLVLDGTTYVQKYFEDNITGQVNDELHNATWSNGAIYVCLISDAYAPPPIGLGRKVKLLKIRRTTTGINKSSSQVGPFDPDLDSKVEDIKIDGGNLITCVENSQTRGAAFLYCDTNLAYKCYTQISGPKPNYFSRVSSFYVDGQKRLVATGFTSPLTSSYLRQWNFKTNDYLTYPMVYCELSGMKEMKISAFEIHPNPCNDHLRILDPNYEIIFIKIIDSKGALIYSEAVSNEAEHQVDITKLQSGLNSIILQTREGLFAKKFFKVE